MPKKISLSKQIPLMVNTEKIKSSILKNHLPILSPNLSNLSYNYQKCISDTRNSNHASHRPTTPIKTSIKK